MTLCAHGAHLVARIGALGAAELLPAGLRVGRWAYAGGGAVQKAIKCMQLVVFFMPFFCLKILHCFGLMLCLLVRVCVCECECVFDCIFVVASQLCSF